jgi:site-specific DNA-methyltransferase (adenine-specific)
MIVEDKAISDIKPYQKNPRHKYDINKVAQSIKEFGFQQPIVVDRAGVIIVGHGRYEAAKSLNLKSIPVTIADLSPEKAKAYRIADNKTNEYSDWDMGLLIQEFTDLLDINYDLELTGFDADELEKLIVGDEKGLTDEDAVPEIPEEPKAQLGDIYKLGEHRLMCGDSTKIDDLDKLLQGKKDLDLLTDPPYGINAEKMTLGKGKKEFHRGEWDKEIPDFFNLLPIFNKIILWGANYYCDKLKSNNDWLCWHKKNDDRSFSEFELAWTNLGKNCRHLSHHWSGEQKDHPTQKPLKVIQWCVDFLGNEIVDIFGGSGSTLLACEKTNRKCYMMELDPKYIDVIIKRWEQYTGQKAEKIN